MTSFKQRLSLIRKMPSGPRRDGARLQWLEDVVSTVPEGRKLLQLAEDSGVAIILSGDMPFQTKGAFDHTPGKMKIFLNAQRKTTSLVETFLHELRHLWQHRVIDFTKAEGLTPQDYMIYKRLIEGDARAFSAAIVKKINDRTDLDLPFKTEGWMGFTRKRQSDAFARRVFSNYQESAIARRYDRKNLDRPFKMVSGLSLSATFNNLHVIASGGMMKKPFYLDAGDLRELFDKIRCEIPARTYRQAQKKSL